MGSETAKTYHWGLSQDDVSGARLAFLPGDPSRVPRIALAFDPTSRQIAWIREFRTFLGKIHGVSVLVTSTGIGGPSASIAVEELTKLDVDTFLRVGTCGCIQPHIRVGDVVITTGAVRMDGASRDYAPIQYPAVASVDVVQALVGAARQRGVDYHVGITASFDTFYPSQERKRASPGGHLLNRLQGTMEEFRRLNVLNYDMESATILTMGSALGLKVGAITGVVVNRVESESVNTAQAEIAESNTISVAVDAVLMMLAAN